MNIKKLGYAFALGYRAAKKARLAQDADRWITVHPNGKENKGQPALIDGQGKIKGGLGGKFKGQKIGEIRKDFLGPKTPTPAQKAAATKAAKKAASVKAKAAQQGNGSAARARNAQPLDGKKSKMFDEAIRAATVPFSTWGKESQAFKFYSYKGDRILNEALRSGNNSKLDEKASQHLKVLDSFFSNPKNGIKAQITTFRGVKGSLADKFRNMKPGEVFTDNGYTSTTAKESIAEGFTMSDNGNRGVILEINIPKGSTAFYMGKHTEFEYEQEILLDRGGTYIFRGKNKDGNLVFDYVPRVPADAKAKLYEEFSHIKPSDIQNIAKQFAEKNKGKFDNAKKVLEEEAKNDDGFSIKFANTSLTALSNSIKYFDDSSLESLDYSVGKVLRNAQDVLKNLKDVDNKLFADALDIAREAAKKAEGWKYILEQQG